MKTLRICFSVIWFFLLAAAANAGDDLLERAQSMFRPISQSPPALKENPALPEKIELGKMLYFDPRLSASNLISCNTCHNVGMGGVDFQETSVGHKWQKGPRNAPTVLNAVFNVAQFWDGRAPDLKEQAKGPVQASVEMNNTPSRAVETIKSMPEYVAMFKKSFPGESDPVTFDNMVKAIAVFEATLLTPDSRFDSYLRGNEGALTAAEKGGLKLFIDKGCSGCHGGMNMGGNGYYAFGVVEKPAQDLMAGDTGRFKVTGVRSDEYVFRAPSLRNITLTPPYFHSGKVWDLEDAVAIMGTSQLGISLNPKETGMITAFLKTTTGTQPKIVYPVLPASTESTPRPKLD